MAKINPPQIIVIVGPTASGKSDLAIKLAKNIPPAGGGEIISADSRQVYRGMDIGTGKVTKKEQKAIRHHLIDVASPKKQFAVSDFKRLGEKAINHIAAKGKIPIIVGGTGFYIDILLGRMAVAQVPPNRKLRAKLEKQSAEQLFKQFSALDPQYSKIIDRHNKRRLIRALEIVLATGKPITNIATATKSTYKILWLGIDPGKDILEKRIKNRLEKRLKRGMLKEVKELLDGGVSHKRLQDFGLEYKWLSLYLQKEISYSEMKDNLLKDIIRYSKRQMTWFKRNKEIKWIRDLSEAKILTEKFLMH